MGMAPEPVQGSSGRTALSGYPYHERLNASLEGAAGALQITPDTLGAGQTGAVDHDPAISGDAETRIKNDEQAGYKAHDALER